jgi:TonB-dependent starch-binding outer membrane protein SusC
MKRRSITKMCALGLTLFFIFTGFVNAQVKTVSGTVLDGTSGSPLPGVNVLIQGTSNGTITDAGGNYQIAVSDPNAVLQFSFVGYLTENAAVGEQTQINITLKEDIMALDELVVIGYGTQRKQDLTGAVTVVDAANLEKIKGNDISRAIQGQATGIQVHGSGEPGAVPSINIRGAGSFTNNEPLYVIDGVPVASQTLVDAGTFAGQFPAGAPSGGIADFSPNDIESIQILKDASACAIYGARGANGVIIITTKRGKSGKLQVTYDGSYGWQDVVKRMEVTDREQFQEMNNLARENNNVNPAPANDPTDPDYIDNINTDWQKEVFTTGHITDHTLGLSGGQENSKFYTSFNYFDQTGTMVAGPSYTRYSVRANLDQQYKKFKFGQSFSYSYSNQNKMTNSQWSSPIYEIIMGIPTVPVYDSNNLGGFGGGIDAIHDQIAGNQVAFNSLKHSYLKRYRFSGVVYGEYEIIKGLNYRINLSYDRSDWLNHEFYPEFNVGDRHTNAIAFLKEWRGENPYLIFENTLTYKRSFGKSDLTAMAGYTVQSDYYQQNYGYAQGYLEPYFEVLSAGPSEQTATGFRNEHTMYSYLGRLNYIFGDRYLATINIRRDYSSRFAPGHKGGTFPSFAAAWKISNESFFDVSFINLLKLRAGYGKIGNEKIGDYRYESYINRNASYVFNGSLPSAGTQTQLTYPDMVWEERITRNIGVDMALFKNKMEITAEYYTNDANNILYEVPVPYSTGTISPPLTNAASMTNKGFEFSLGYKNYDGDFKYGFSANLTTLKNEVTKLGSLDRPTTTYMSKTEVGGELGQLYGWDFIGIFQNQTEIDTHAFQNSRTAPGDCIFRDVDGDSIITDNDRIFLGSAFPKLTGGFSINLGYKGFDLSIFFQGVYGNKIFNGVYAVLNSNKEGNYSIESYENYWRGEGTTNVYPRPSYRDYNNNNRVSQRFIQDGSYLRLQDLQLGYTLPGKVLNKIPGVGLFRLYLSCQNLLTFTKYTGFDPDINNNGLFLRAEDWGSYPAPRSIIVGVKLTL